MALEEVVKTFSNCKGVPDVNVPGKHTLTYKHTPVVALLNLFD